MPPEILAATQRPLPRFLLRQHQPSSICKSPVTLNYAPRMCMIGPSGGSNLRVSHEVRAARSRAAWALFCMRHWSTSAPVWRACFLPFSRSLFRGPETCPETLAGGGLGRTQDMPLDLLRNRGHRPGPGGPPAYPLALPASPWSGCRAGCLPAPPCAYPLTRLVDPVTAPVPAALVGTLSVRTPVCVHSPRSLPSGP